MPLLHSSLNRNKKSVTLDLKTAQGKEIFRRLAAASDVLCDNMRPDTLQRLGLGYEALRTLNPGLIYVSLTGFGHTDIYQSPYADWPAFDSVGQAMSGFMYSVGSEEDPPMASFIAPADTIPGLLAAYGVMLALHMRESTGQGQHVDMSMYDCMVMLTSPMVTFAAHMNQRYPRGQSPASAPYGAYKAKDGYVALHAAGEPAWQRFCRAIEREDLLQDSRFATLMQRVKHQPLLREIIESWAADKTVEEVVSLLQSRGAVAAPVQDERALVRCPQLRARNMLFEVDVPDAGKAITVGNPVKLSAVPEQPPAPPPRLGEHTEEVLQSVLGLSRSEIEELRAAKAI